MAALIIEDLTISYGTLDAVKNLSLEAELGEVLVILGSNGAGKTSTIEAAQGLRTVSGGRIELLGLDPRSDRPELMPRIGVMPQEGGLSPAARPGELLSYYQMLFEQPQDSHLLDRLGLGDKLKSKIRHLSGGEKQRLSLALALVSKPEVLFLDEVTSGVDAQGRSLIREIIAEQKNLGTAVVVTTHELAEAEKIADKVAVLHLGELRAFGGLQELLEDAPNIKFRTKPDTDLSGLASEMNCEVTEPSPGLYALDTDRDATSVAKLTTWLAGNDIELEELLAKRESLEDLFLRITKEEQ